MKGIFFQNGIELQIQTEGEKWSQGDIIKGKALLPPQFKGQIHLANADFKDVHAKKDKAFYILKSIPATASWELALPSDAAITEKNSSLYLLLEDAGNLQLNVVPHPILCMFLENFELFFRFKALGFKTKMLTKKNFLEVKMAPPKSKDFGNMDALNLYMRFNEDNKNIDLQYHFTVRSLMVGAAGLTQVEKKKKILEQSILPAQYELYKGAGAKAANQEKLQMVISEILNQVKTKALF